VERVLSCVVFGDLSGFTSMADGTDEATYLDFIGEFRGAVFSCIEPLLAGNRIEYGFWGDEVKVLFIGPSCDRNVHDGLQCAADIARRWDTSPTNGARRREGKDALRFKIGVATGEVTVGLFAGARWPESEGHPLCVARSLSKWARDGLSSRIYVDASTRDLLQTGTALERLRRVVDREDVWEIDWP
jgi:class 3 adenylate cyclase